MSELWSSIVGAVVSALVALVAPAFLAWLWKSYRHILSMLRTAGELLGEQKKTNQLLSDALTRLDNHEMRIETLEERMKRERESDQ